MDTYSTSPKNSTSVVIERRYPIIAKHYGFGQEAAADAHRMAPRNRDFTDRPPPGAPTAVKPKPPQDLDIVAALRAKRRAA